MGIIWQSTFSTNKTSLPDYATGQFSVARITVRVVLTEEYEIKHLPQFFGCARTHHHCGHERGVWPFKDASWLKKKMRWCIRYYSRRERGRCVWNVCFDAVRLWEKTWTETNRPYLRTILCGNTAKEKNCNVPWVAPWQRKCLWRVKCVFCWRRPQECLPPMETNRPWWHLIFVCASAWWNEHDLFLYLDLVTMVVF